MSLSRALVAFLLLLLTAVAGIVLYLQFGDMNRHRHSIQNLVTEGVGREFHIIGDLKVKLFPSTTLTADGLTLANASWANQPLMLEVGELSVALNPWSLLDGPLEIERFTLDGIKVLEEHNREGQSNWDLAAASPESRRNSGDTNIEAADSGGLPIVIHEVKIQDAILSLLRPDTEDRIIQVYELTFQPGSSGNLDLSGTGQFLGLPLALSGAVGPLEQIKALGSVDIGITGSLGKLAVQLDGQVENLEQLSGARLELKAHSEEAGELITAAALALPLSGPIEVTAQLTQSDHTLDIDLRGSADAIEFEISAVIAEQIINFNTSVTNLARVGELFEVEGLPAESLQMTGVIITLDDGIELQDVEASLGDTEVKVSGTLHGNGETSTLDLDVRGSSLADLMEELPAIPFAVTTDATLSTTQVQLDDLKAEFGESDLAGTAHVIMEDGTTIRANLKSRQIDLVPFQASGSEAADEVTVAPGEVKSEEQYVFVAEPLPFEVLKNIDADVQVAIGELKGAGPKMEDLLFDGRLQGDKLTGQVEFGIADGGAVVSTISLVTEKENADLELSLMARDLRINVASGEIDDPARIPPISVTLDLKSSGLSPRTIAAGATGQLLITQGAGRVDNALLGRISGDIFTQLASALNPMAKAEKYTKIECGIIVVDFANGMSDLGTFVIQGEKVLIVADGTVDLDSEQLNIEFNTQPRKGIGVSADMFVTPFIALKGTLMAPAVGLNQEGTLITGGTAVATGGISLLVQAALERVTAQVDHCEKTLPEFPHPPLKAA
ncbi:MAG: AsmA family protein [Halioglobus sp.]